MVVISISFFPSWTSSTVIVQAKWSDNNTDECRLFCGRFSEWRQSNVRHVLLAQNMPSAHREYWEQQIMPIERGMDETDNGEDTREWLGAHFRWAVFITLACSMNIEEGVHLVEIRKGVGISIWKGMAVYESEMRKIRKYAMRFIRPLRRV